MVTAAWHTGAMIDGELGAFLRSRREATAPADVGLRAGTRRRTPGLRRAELATLAGVSVDYLIRLEQGRDTHPSPQVLAALADAMQLDGDERDHLRNLSVVSQGAELCPMAMSTAAVVRPAVEAILRSLEPSPAFVVNHLGDVLSWNDGYDRLMRPLGLFEGERPNLVRYTFTDERSRVAYPDWDDVADAHVANLFAEARHPGDDVRTMATALADEAGKPFRHRWERGAVARRRVGVEALDHPAIGRLRMSFEVLDLPDLDRQRLVVSLPADAATSTGLDRLAGREPGALRSVEAG